MPDLKRWRVRSGCGLVSRVDWDGERRDYGPGDVFEAEEGKVSGCRDKLEEVGTVSTGELTSRAEQASRLHVRARPDGMYDVGTHEWRLNDVGLTYEQARSLL